MHQHHRNFYFLNFICAEYVKTVCCINKRKVVCITRKKRRKEAGHNVEIEFEACAQFDTVRPLSGTVVDTIAANYCTKQERKPTQQYL